MKKSQAEINTSQTIERAMNQIQNPKQTIQYRNLIATLVPYTGVEHSISHVHDEFTGEWEEIVAVMDSGAVDSVAPTVTAEHIETAESPGSRCGQKYLAACGTKLPNKGPEVVHHCH